MKSNSLLLALALLGSASALQAKMETVHINSQRLLMESKRGKALQAELEADAKGLQELQQSLSAGLQEQSQTFQKNAALMTPEAQQAELHRLQLAERQAQHELQGKQEILKMAAQQKQEAARRGLITVASNMLEKEQWGALMDSSQPGVIAVNKDLDVTAKVLAQADDLFAEELSAQASHAADEVVQA